MQNHKNPILIMKAPILSVNMTALGLGMRDKHPRAFTLQAASPWESGSGLECRASGLGFRV